MSLVTTMSGVANRLIGPQGLAGFVVTFSRSATVSYDAINNVEGPPNPLTWTGRATWAKNGGSGADATLHVDASGRHVITRTLLVPGASVSQAPQTGDMIVGGGVSGVCGDVDNVGDASGATVPLYRVKVAA